MIRIEKSKPGEVVYVSDHPQLTGYRIQFRHIGAERNSPPIIFQPNDGKKLRLLFTDIQDQIEKFAMSVDLFGDYKLLVTERHVMDKATGNIDSDVFNEQVALNVPRRKLAVIMIPDGVFILKD